MPEGPVHGGQGGRLSPALGPSLKCRQGLGSFLGAPSSSSSNKPHLKVQETYCGFSKLESKHTVGSSTRPGQGPTPGSSPDRQQFTPSSPASQSSSVSLRLQEKWARHTTSGVPTHAPGMTAGLGGLGFLPHPQGEFAVSPIRHSQRFPLILWGRAGFPALPYETQPGFISWLSVAGRGFQLYYEKWPGFSTPPVRRSQVPTLSERQGQI